MRKGLISVTFFFWLLHISIFTFGKARNHLSELTSKFPNGLVGDDYGVLTTEDLALNTCRLKPPPFSPGATHVYEYWICFKSKEVLPTCEDEGVMDVEGHVGRVNVEARKDEIVYQFFEQRPWPLKECKAFVRDLKRVIKRTSHACVSASSITQEEKNEKGQMERVGIFGRLKTHRGCEGRECKLTKKTKKEFCPQLQL